MTDAFRRRSDLLAGTAIHLLIDARPAGWMKAWWVWTAFETGLLCLPEKSCPSAGQLKD